MKRGVFLGLMALGSLAVAAACKQASSAGQFVVSADGTKIAYDRFGKGPAVVIVGGMLSHRGDSSALAQALAADFTVYTFDRRGRGDSGDTEPYAIEREIEDIAAIRDAAGGDIALVGHSSGAGLSLAAAASSVPVRALVLHEPPFGASDAASRRKSAEAAATVRQLIAANRHDDAIASFLTYVGMPAAAAKQTAADPKMQRMAPSMLHDLDVMASDGGSLLPEGRVRALKAKTVVLVGSKAPPPFHAAGKRIAELAPGGDFIVLEGQEHVADPAVLADAIRKALKGASEVRSAQTREAELVGA